MTYKQIEAAKEARRWLTHVVLPIAGMCLYVKSQGLIDGGDLKAKALAAKDRVISKFKKKTKLLKEEFRYAY